MPRTSSKNNWRQWARPLAVSLYLLSIIVTVPLCIWEIQRAEVGIHSKAWVLAGVFLFMTVPVSLWGVLQHIVHYTQPELKEPVIRILWMVPIYSLDSSSSAQVQTGGSAVYSDQTCHHGDRFFAMYCLLLFYYTLKEELRPLYPVGKFLCEVGHFCLFLDILVCLEMVVAGIAHHSVFSHIPFVQKVEEASWFKSFLAMWDFADLRDDISEQIRHVGVFWDTEKIMAQMERGETKI